MKNKKKKNSLVRANLVRIIKQWDYSYKNPNPVFVQNTVRWWRKRLIYFIGKCQVCMYSKHKQILQLHHIDHNEKNNIECNLLLLCPNCHCVVHLFTKRHVL